MFNENCTTFSKVLVAKYQMLCIVDFLVSSGAGNAGEWIRVLLTAPALIKGMDASGMRQISGGVAD